MKIHKVLLGKLPKFLQLLGLVIILFSLELFSNIKPAYAACRLGDIKYPTGKRIVYRGETLECQADGTWKKIKS